MHTAWVRLNAVVFFGLTVLLGLSVLTALSTYFHRGFPDIRKLGVSKFRTFRNSEGTDRLLLNINVDADLAPAFNWNIKQLFAFVVAEYETKTNPFNQVILWDKIVESPEEAHLLQHDMTVKYGLIDEGAGLRNTSVTLMLYWDHMPLTGTLFQHSVPVDTFECPVMREKDRRTSRQDLPGRTGKVLELQWLVGTLFRAKPHLTNVVLCMSGGTEDALGVIAGFRTPFEVPVITAFYADEGVARVVVYNVMEWPASKSAP